MNAMNETNAVVMQTNMDESEMTITPVKQRKAASAIGWRYALFALIVIIFQLGVSMLLNVFAPEWTAANATVLSLILVLVSVDIFGFGSVLILNANLKKTVISKKNMTFGAFVLAIFMSACLMGVGMIIGTIFHAIFSLPSGSESTNALGELMIDSSMWLRVLVVGIGAPIFEEIIFRKILIDRTVKYGEFLAILLSGLMFGLFHGNFSQFFFATFIGLFFAFIYVKTGKVWYTILLHMIINLTTSVGTVFFLQKFLDAIGNETPAEIEYAMMHRPFDVLGYLLWMLLLALAAFSGLIIWIVILVKKKISLNPEEKYLKKGMTFISAILNPGFILFFLVCGIIFFMQYGLPVIQKILEIF